MRLLVVVALTCTVGGCASVGGLRSAPIDVGKARIFHAVPDRTFQAARRAFWENVMEVKEITRPDSVTWVLIGQQQGEGLVRAVVRPASDSTTEVRVLTKTRWDTRDGARADWSGFLFVAIAKELGDSGVTPPPTCEELGGRSATGTQNGKAVMRCLMPG